MRRIVAMTLLTLVFAASPQAEEITYARALLCGSLFENHNDPRRDEALNAAESLGHMYSSAERQEKWDGYLEYLASYDNKQDERAYLAECRALFGG